MAEISRSEAQERIAYFICRNPTHEEVREGGNFHFSVDVSNVVSTAPVQCPDCDSAAYVLNNPWRGKRHYRRHK
jgi:hypothetical protein